MTVILFGIIISGCLEETTKSKFEVHEWGVFAKGYDCNATSVLTRAPPTYGVLKPVIYFHSLKDRTNVEVKVDSIKNATVIPNATIGNNQILWNVIVENNTVIGQNGAQKPYLFYEGEITYPQTVVTGIAVNGTTVTFYVKNIADYAISDVYFIYGYPTGKPPYTFMSPRGITYIQIDKLEKNEEKMVITQLTNDSSYNVSKLLLSLIEKGLTTQEAQEMIDYWTTYWFYPTNVGNYTRLLYIVPQSVYDQLLPLSITPTPDVIKRVGLFTITDIPIVISGNTSDKSNITATLSTDKTSYKVNETVNGTITVINNLKENVLISPVPYFTIFNEQGEPVYWYMMPYIVTIDPVTLSPGEEKSIHIEWDQKHNNGTLVPTGNYTIKAWILTTVIPRIDTNTVTIRIQ